MWQEIEATARAAEQDGARVGVALIMPDGKEYAYRGNEAFIAASTVKIGIMVAIYRLIDAGKRSLNERYVLRDAAKTPGSGILLHLHDGIELTLNDLIYLMISISDNTATNILIEMAGMDQVNAVMRSLGMQYSTLERPMRGVPAAAGAPENWATPADYCRAVQAILTDRAASPASCDAMTLMLERQQNRQRIARHLPHRDGIRWGSKTGTVGAATNDAGFITGPDGTLFVSVFTTGLPNVPAGEAVIGELSRLAVQWSNVLVRSAEDGKGT